MEAGKGLRTHLRGDSPRKNRSISPHFNTKRENPHGGLKNNGENGQKSGQFPDSLLVGCSPRDYAERERIES